MNPRYPGYDRKRKFPVEFLLLGPLEVRDNGRVVAVGATKQRALLAFLALHPNQLVSRDRLIDELWGGVPPATVTTSLRVRVAELRRLLEPERRAGARTGVIDGRNGGYLLRVDPDAVDAFRFESLVKAAGGQPPETAAAILREALALWRGDALQDFTYEPFAQPAITRLEELRLVATEKRIDADLALGRHAELVPELEELLRHHPHREALRAQLMLALYRSGRQGEALAAYREGRRVLLDELGIEPSEQLKELEQAILRHDRGLQLAGEAVSRPLERTELRSPYKGLRPFAEADTEDFFGRDALVAELLARLGTGVRFICVLGASGSGKSSVVKAGLVPALRAGAVEGSEQWTYVEIMPGGQPLVELETALLRVAHNPPSSLIEQLEGDPYGLYRAVGRVLPDDGSELLLVVDQLEELFMIGADEPTRAHVLESLRLAVTHPRSRLRVVATLRADFHDRPLRYREFGALLEESTVVALPLSADELERAIAGPAERVGAYVEPALVAEIVADLTDQPGSLPLLQYALTEVFEQRETDTLTVERYRAVGGVSTALAARAEQLYAELDEQGQRTARRLLLRLVTLGEGTMDTRRRVPRAELEALADRGEADRFFDALTAHRLLSTDRDPETDAATVEIAHEALLREWPRLKGWIDDDREGLRRLRHLSDAAASWQRLDRDEGELYRGARLEQALAWQEEHPEDLNALEVAFLAASRELRDAEQAAEAERVQQRNRQNRRLRIALAVVAVALAAAVAGGIFALLQRGDARDAADRAAVAATQARDAETAQLAQRLGAQALVEEDLDLSLLLARQAVAVDDTPQTRGYLLAALQRRPAVIGIMHSGKDEDLRRIALSPDGRTLAVAGFGGAGIRFFDAETYQQIGEPVDVPTASYGVKDVGVKDVFGLTYSPDGKTLAFFTGTDWNAPGYLRVIDPQTREVLAEARTLALDVAYTRDGSLLVLTELSPLGGGPLPVTFLDSATLAPVGNTIHLGVGSTPADRERASYPSLQKVSPFFALTPDGGSVVTASPDGELAWWDLESREKTKALAIAEGYHAFALSPDGLTAALGIDGGVQLLDLRSGNVRTASRVLAGEPQWLLFSPDSETLVSTGLDGTVTLWDIETATPRETLRGHSASVGQPVFSPDGATLYTASDDGTAIAWDIDESRRLGRPFKFTHDGAYAPLSDRHPGKLSPDGRLIAVGLEKQGIALLDARELTPVGTPLLETGGEVKALAFSPNGQTLAAVTRDGMATLWDVDSGSIRRGPIAVDVRAIGVSFSTDGTMLATAGQQGVRLWDVATGGALGTIGDGTTTDDVAFSPTGPFVAFVVDEWEPVPGRRDTTAHAEIWDVAQRSRIARVEVNAGAPDRDESLGYTLAFSPDGRLLAIAGDDPLVHVWDVGTRRLVRELEQNVSGVQALDFSSDGRMLAISGKPDASLWDIATGTQVGRFSGGSRGAMLDLSPDGRRLLMTNANGQGAVWDIDPEFWKQRACALANRTLTREEWNEFLPGRAYEPACAA